MGKRVGVLMGGWGEEREISLRTGENHLRSIYRKVGVGSRTQLLSRLLQIH